MTTEELSSRAQRHTEPKKMNKNNKGKKKHKLLFRIILGLVLLGVIGLLSGFALFWSYASKSPEPSDEKLIATVSSKIFDGNNNVIEELGAEKRETLKPTEVPQRLKDAVISVEDKRFYDHIGVDPIRIIGSALSNFRGQGGLQGGSTLTQQLIKLSYFSTKESDQTLERKSQEAWLAIQLEREKSKDEILTYYINKVYMANGLYGMETAAQGYYGKTSADLSIAQTALLAGMPQAPNDYDPYTQPENAKKRRDVVLLTMLDNKKITQQEYDEAVNTPITDGLVELETSNDRKVFDNYLKEVIAEVEAKTGKNVYTDGLEIHTNLDMAAQQRLYDIVNTDQYVEYPDADFQVASTVIDVKTGQVKAQIGGRNIADDVQLGNNLAVSTARDVGSTMKPIADYGPAIEYLNYSTGKILYDKPTNYQGTTTAVYNADLQYYGALTMRRAIMGSRNTTAVQTFDAVGKEKVAEFLKGLDITFDPLVDANAISSNKNDLENTDAGVSSLKLAASYAAFANGGVYNKPYYVNKVIYQDGSFDEFAPTSKQAMKDSTAFMMTSMLKDVISGGTAFNAGIDGLIQAGKTGTSNYTDEDLAKIGIYSDIAPDSTFVGYTQNYSVSVWTGYNDRLTPIHFDYWGTASDVYREMMTYLSEGVPNEDWVMPESVIQIGSEYYVKDAAEVQTTTTTTSQALDNYYSTESVSPESSDVTPPSSSSNTVVEPSSSSEPVVEPEVPTTPSSSTTIDPVPSSSSENTGGGGGNTGETTPPAGGADGDANNNNTG